MRDDEQKKKFAMMIADAIQNLLRNSDELLNILEDAHEQGYDVLLTIFSGIMVRQRSERQTKEEKSEEMGSLPTKFEFTKSDKDFLRSIGIQVPGE